MLWLKKQGIRFALVDRRFESFAGMTGALHSALARSAKGPIVVVFPEDVLPNKEVPRSETKRWIHSITPVLRRHGTAFVFFSIFEKAAFNGPLTNTGYLVQPFSSKKDVPRVNWQAYAKIGLMNGDRIRLSGEELERPWQFEGWKARVAHVTQRNSREPGNPLQPLEFLGFSFPSVQIGRKRLELRVCADLDLKSRRSSDILVVPAWGFGFDNRPRSDALQNLVGSLVKNGFVVLHDVTPESSNPRLVRPRNRVPPQIHEKAILRKNHR